MAQHAKRVGAYIGIWLGAAQLWCPLCHQPVQVLYLARLLVHGAFVQAAGQGQRSLLRPGHWPGYLALLLYLSSQPVAKLPILEISPGLCMMRKASFIPQHVTLQSLDKFHSLHSSGYKICNPCVKLMLHCKQQEQESAAPCS